MRTKSVTLGQLARHDFSRALRVWSRCLAPLEILRLLVAEREICLKHFLRQITVVVAGLFWLSANDGNLNLHVLTAQLNVPLAFVNFATSALLYGAMISLLNYFAINSFVARASNYLFKFDAPWVLTIPLTGSNSWILPYVRQFRFLQLPSSQAKAGFAILFLISIPFVLFLGAAYWMIISTGLHVIRQSGLSLESIFTCTAFVLVLIPPILAVLSCVPISLRKNIMFVRWLFLFPIYRRIGQQHPQVDLWIAK